MQCHRNSEGRLPADEPAQKRRDVGGHFYLKSEVRSFEHAWCRISGGCFESVCRTWHKVGCCAERHLLLKPRAPKKWKGTTGVYRWAYVTGEAEAEASISRIKPREAEAAPRSSLILHETQRNLYRGPTLRRERQSEAGHGPQLTRGRLR